MSKLSQRGFTLIQGTASSGKLRGELACWTAADGTSYPIFRRHLDAETLADEIRGDPLFNGQYFVLASAPC